MIYVKSAKITRVAQKIRIRICNCDIFEVSISLAPPEIFKRRRIIQINEIAKRLRSVNRYTPNSCISDTATFSVKYLSINNKRYVKCEIMICARDDLLIPHADMLINCFVTLYKYVQNFCGTIRLTLKADCEK